MAFPSFKTERLLVRPIKPTDAKGLHKAFGDPAAMRFWDRPPARNVDETRGWIPKSTPHFGMWAVLAKDGKRFLGMVNFHARNATHRRLAIGYILAREHWRKGFMHEALVPFIGYCFATLGCHRVEALIEPANAASKALAEKLGFRAEGVLRDWLCVKGEFRSVVMYALFEDDWQARHPKPAAARRVKTKR
jgi:[ribosomal protein S5]-alanine N-acetyltransferase